MSKNTNIADLINYISVDESGNVVLTTGGQVATQSYVTTAISNLVNAAPSTLDTLNELAAALGNDANFATTVTNSIATKLPLSGGTLTGVLQIRHDGGSSADAVIRLRGTNSTARTTRLQFEDYNGTLADGFIDFKIPTAGVANSATLSLGINSAGLTFNSTNAATFSNSVTSTRYILTPSGSSAIYNIIDATSTYTGSYIIQAGGGSAGFGGAIIAYGHSHASKPGWITAGISAGSGGKFSVNNQGNGAGTDIFTVDATGPAAFSSTLTASGVRSINGGVDGTYQDAFVGVYSSNNNEQNAIQTAVSSGASLSGFRFQASNGGGSAGRTTVLDLTRDRSIFYNSVGIGTTSPNYALHVSSSSEFQIAFTRSSINKTWALGMDSNAVYLYNVTNGVLPFYVMNNGNFLIGTTTDNSSFKLQVNGTIRTAGLSITDNYSAQFTTDSSWTSFQNVIPANTLNPYETYLIEIRWEYNGATYAPYYANASFLFKPVPTNSTGTNNAIDLQTSCHIGGNYIISVAQQNFSNASCGGLALKLSWSSSAPSYVLVKAKRIAIQ